MFGKDTWDPLIINMSPSLTAALLLLKDIRYPAIISKGNKGRGRLKRRQQEGHAGSWSGQGLGGHQEEDDGGRFKRKQQEVSA